MARIYTMNTAVDVGTLVCNFEHLKRSDVFLVGGKSSSLGEMITAIELEGITVLPGFATTSHVYWHYVDASGIRKKAATLIADWQSGKASLADMGHAARSLLLRGTQPPDAASAVRTAYCDPSARAGIENLGVVVCSSTTAGDLPDASFAGQLESYLNISGEDGSP